MLQEDMIRYRAETGLSMERAAQKAGITLQTWMNVERGIQSPSRVTETKIRMIIEEKEVQ